MNNKKKSRKKKRAIVAGAGGFIGSHLVERLVHDGYFVRGVDLKYPEFSATFADEFILADLKNYQNVELLIDESFDEIYQLAADMGGAGYIFSGENDATIMHHSATINLNVLEVAKNKRVQSVFFSSSACIYPSFNQKLTEQPICEEDSAYPALPDSEYGWEKLFSERLYLAYKKNFGMDVKIARLHNIFGPLGTWTGGREKAPAAICRKVALAKGHDSIELWGDGRQTRSFLFIDECIEGICRLMRSQFAGPVNIGSDEMISIGDLAKMVIGFSGKNIEIQHIDGPTGVRGRTSHNQLILRELGWSPKLSLEFGMKILYQWVQRQVDKSFYIPHGDRMEKCTIRSL